MLVSKSPATEPHLVDRAASSGVQENSLRKFGSDDLSYASLTLESDTDLLPYCWRTLSSFGRLMPTGVMGPASPVSMTTSMALAVMPCTLGLRYFASHGIRSSN